jgi:iron complex transport system permease protein
MIDSEWPHTWLVAVTHRLARRSATTRITRYAPRPLPAPGSVTAIPTHTPMRNQSSRRTDGALVAPSVLFVGSAVLLVLAVVLGVGIGAYPIAPWDTVRILLAHVGLPVAVDPQQDAILWAIRLPRVLLGILVGGALAISGAALQGVFRNPLADPTIVGVASGASVGAVAAILIGLSGAFYGGIQVSAFCGGIVAVLVVYALARHEGRTETITLVLVGVAVTAIAGAVIGLMIASADDDELRDIVFWSLGSLGSATWPLVVATVPFVCVGAVAALTQARTLDLLSLGEREASHLGVEVEQARLLLVVALALATSAAVAAAGIVAFVGLIVPHLVRLIGGPSHRVVLPVSLLAGGALLALADLVARTVAAPVELPLGVVTALVGGPLFLWLVLRTRRTHGGWA